MNKFYAVLTVLWLSAAVVNAQKIPQTFKGKTHMMSTDELLHLNQVGKDFIETTPPTGQVRSIAEFERTTGIIVTYLSGWSDSYFGIPEDLIAEISEDTKVYTVVSDESAIAQVESIYNNYGVNIDNVIFTIAPTDSYWTRDYSPWFIANDNEVEIVNFPYNRPRPNDNDIPLVFGDNLDVNVYGMNLVSTGGNYMSDGMGVAASCDLVLTENPELTQTQVKNLVHDYLGINTYHLLDDPLDDYIEHIDCWGKFLDVDKILITQVPKTDYRYNDFEAIADYWANQTTSYGNKYQVYRVYSPNGQPYTNSLILNNKVLVPIVTGTGSNYNADALAVYQQAMPGYEIIGFDENPSAPWESTDALHCRTHEIPDMEMLYIKHVALHDTLPSSTTELTVSANVVSYGSNDVESVELFCKINDDAEFTQVSMTAVAKSNAYSAVIDNILPEDSIQYFIKARDASGRVETHPFIGAADPHKCYIAKQQVGVSNNLAQKSMTIYPNPVFDRADIIVHNFTPGLLHLLVSDLNGRIVLSQQINITQSWQKIDLDMTQLNQGVYVVTLSNGKQWVKQKLLKQ